MADYKEGDVVTNAQGAKLVLSGGAWVPIGGLGAAAPALNASPAATPSIPGVTQLPATGFQNAAGGGQTVIPGSEKDPNYIAKVKKVETDAAFQDSARKSYPKVRDQLASAQAEYEKVVKPTIDSLLDPKSNALNAWSTGFMGRFKDQAGLPAYDLEQQLLPLRGLTAINNLNEMRQQSPTGGAVGNVSDADIRLLSSVLGTLDPGMKPSALKFNLKRVDQMYKDALDRRRQAFNQDYGFMQKDQSTADPNVIYYNADGTIKK